MIIGIDEVGRGCWAGPLVAGAVVLHSHVAGLDDSKKLTKLSRTRLATQISENADIGLGWVTPAEVDNLGLTAAVGLAMQRAFEQLSGIHGNFDSGTEVIIDGNYNFLPHISNSQAIIRADGTVPAVSAASIVAKVARDTFMQQLPAKYDLWQFANHVGYGTALHQKLLYQHGVSDIHRRSYKPIQRLL